MKEWKGINSFFVVILFSINTLFFLPILCAFQPCSKNAQGEIMCNGTQFQGTCGSFYSPKESNWCHDDPNDICCGQSVDDCCQTQDFKSLGTVLIVCLISITCCCIICCRRKSFIWRCVSLHVQLGAQDGEEGQDECQDPEQRKKQITKETEALMKLSHQPHSSLEPTKECVVCMERKRDSVLPCGHSLLCSACIENILKTQTKQCPTCRKSFLIYEKVSYECPSYRSLNEHARVLVFLDSIELNRSNSRNQIETIREPEFYNQTHQQEQQGQQQEQQQEQQGQQQEQQQGQQQEHQQGETQNSSDHNQQLEEEEEQQQHQQRNEEEDDNVFVSNIDLNSLQRKNSHTFINIEMVPMINNNSTKEEE